MSRTTRSVIVNVAEQSLSLLQAGQVIWQARVATAKNGVGQINGSQCTPLGQHVIRARVGAGQAPDTVFVRRRPTGEIYTPVLRRQFPQRDWILTRILWLSGCEPGFNRLGNVDTMRRYIYIHGCPDEDVMGVPSSHGCVKMRNADIIYLFDQVSAGTEVNIIAGTAIP